MEKLEIILKRVKEKQESLGGLSLEYTKFGLYEKRKKKKGGIGEDNMNSAYGEGAEDSVGGVENEDVVDAPVDVAETGAASRNQISPVAVAAGVPPVYEVMANGEKLFDEFEELEEVVEDDFW